MSLHVAVGFRDTATNCLPNINIGDIDWEPDLRTLAAHEKQNNRATLLMHDGRRDTSSKRVRRRVFCEYGPRGSRCQRAVGQIGQRSVEDRLFRLAGLDRF